MEFGNLKDKGYRAGLYLLFPIFRRDETESIFGDKLKAKLISFPTYFLLTSNNNYVKIEGAILGFGLKFEINTKEI